jgi:hypothetical protein
VGAGAAGAAGTAAAVVSAGAFVGGAGAVVVVGALVGGAGRVLGICGVGGATAAARAATACAKGECSSGYIVVSHKCTSRESVSNRCSGANTTAYSLPNPNTSSPPPPPSPPDSVDSKLVESDLR